MSKVFRLHKNGAGLIDWTRSKKYGSDVVEQIEDPSGARADKEITSIPSPFARIDLAKSAFRNVGMGDGNVKGDTAYHKIVSESLDIGELFFNYNRMSNKIDIIVWDRAKQIGTLKASRTAEQKMVGNTLEMFLGQDAKAYNFDRLDRIYLLAYKGNRRKSEMDIIGATSPCTLFFSSANDLSYMSEDLRQNGQYKPFDSSFTPLYERDIAFQRYLWAIVKSQGIDKFAKYFPEFYAYLKKNYTLSDEKVKDIIDSVDETTIDEYEQLKVSGNTVEVLGIPFGKSKGINASEMESDFMIVSSIYNGIRPLVLPVEAGNTYKEYKYIQDYWESTTRAPYVDYSEIENRTLPASSQKYPYLTISDFLQPTIICMPYPLNRNFFFDGVNDSEGKNNQERTFLLPLKEKFFDFFTANELRGTVSDGKRMFEIDTYSRSYAKVTLRVPIKKGYIEYVRKYVLDATPDEECNEGGAVVRKFGLGIMPMVNLEHNYIPKYRIPFFCKEFGGKLEFAGREEVKPKAHVIRRETSQDVCSVESYVLEDTFDRIFVTVGGAKNVIIPKFNHVSDTSTYMFAIDFGTTNTHIEYLKKDNRESHAFDIDQEEKQLVKLNMNYGSEMDVEDAFEDAFLPQTIGHEDGYSFPIRTALAEWKAINYRSQTVSLAHCNIPFRYEKAGVPKYNKIQTDIKWQKEIQGTARMFLENLFILMRNKVVMNGGQLAGTQIVWFYPASMSQGQKDLYNKIWKELYEEYFGRNTSANLIDMSESVAPWYFYKNRRGAKSNVVTIDVGGGTTDVLVVVDNKAEMLSSVRFAANAIFGDSYNFSVDTNGFVRVFEEEILNILESNDLKDLKKVYEAIKSAGKSEDIAAFFFSLKTNKTIREKNIPMDFQDMLEKNSRMKYVFIIFYGAILYYVACMMKAKGLDLPQTLAFSGNGSRSLGVLSTNNSVLSKFASLIFEKVFGVKYQDGQRLDVIFDENPKLATCKGGIARIDELTRHSRNIDDKRTDDSYEKIDEIRTSLLGTDNTTFCDNKHYNSIGDTEISKVAHSVSDFVDFLFELNRENNNFFVKNFVADGTVIEKVKEKCKEDLNEYTKQGLIRKLDEMSNDKEEIVEETMFFYPIVPMLNRVANMLSE